MDGLPGVSGSDNSGYTGIPSDSSATGSGYPGASSASQITTTFMDNLKNLIEHDPSFESTNPNHLRAIINTFSHNPQFHRADGAGYLFLAEFIKRIDGENSELSARLARPLLQIHGLDATHQAALQKSIDILKTPPVSQPLKDLLP